MVDSSDAGWGARLTDRDIQEALGENLEQILSLDTWSDEANLDVLYNSLVREIADAVRFETETVRAIRKHVLPKLRNRPGAIPEAGVYRASPEDVKLVHINVLFNGGAEACDANIVSHDTLPITVAQLAVALVRYNGSQNVWAHQIYRRDLRARHEDLVEQALALLERRQLRSGFDVDEGRDPINRLLRRGIMSYIERAALVERTDRPWRIGHGHPVPFELLTGSGFPDLLRRSLNILDALLCQHKRFLFVPSAPGRRELLTIGNALEPLEYVILGDLYDDLFRIASRNRMIGAVQASAIRFVEQVGPQIVVGMYRTGVHTPAHLFYAHREYAHEAALLAISDSALQQYRGFPMLIDLADAVCRHYLGLESFMPTIETAYAEAGMPFRYLPERRTRQRN